MLKQSLLFISLSITFVVISGFPHLEPFSFHRVKSINPISRNDIDWKNLPKPRFFNQTLDHFNPLNRLKLSHRYFVNDTFWNSNRIGTENADRIDRIDAPVFVYLEGESPASAISAVDGNHVELARVHKALIIVVEHRYYGKSLPLIQNLDYAVPNLQWLSSEQALADMAVLIEHLQEEFGYSILRNKIVVFGGSYPGALAAYARIKYPHIVYASVASSATVGSKFEYPEYAAVVNDSFSDPIAGGSTFCSDEMAKGFAYIDEVFDSGDQKSIENLSNMFHACSNITETKDQQTFAYKLFLKLAGAAQYNGQDGSTQIADICAVITNSTANSGEEAATKLAKALRFQGRFCSNFQYSSLAMAFEDLEPQSLFHPNVRAYQFQLCSQSGHFFACKEGCAMSKYLTADLFIDVYKDVFGLSKEEIQERVDLTRSNFGSFHPGGSRIIFVNGDIDPWYKLGVLKDYGDQQFAIVIRGASHCHDLSSPEPGDSEFLKEGRRKIAAQLAKWLEPLSKTDDSYPVSVSSNSRIQ